MNGKELMESMGYVDEKYIQEAADAPRRRRLRWQVPAACAACLALALAGVWQFLPVGQKHTESVSLQADAGPAVAGILREEQDDHPAARTSGSPRMARMTVRVVEQTPEALLCVVTDPGTSDFQPDDRVQIALPREEAAGEYKTETAATQPQTAAAQAETEDDAEITAAAPTAPRPETAGQGPGANAANSAFGGAASPKPETAAGAASQEGTTAPEDRVEAAEDAASTDSNNRREDGEQQLYQVVFLPDQDGDVITAVEWTLAPAEVP